MINEIIKPTDMDNILLASVWDGVNIDVGKYQVVINMYQEAKKDPEGLRRKVMSILNRLDNVKLTEEQLEQIQREAKLLKSEIENDTNSLVSGKLMDKLHDKIIQFVHKGMIIFCTAVINWVVLDKTSDEYIQLVHLADYPLIVKALNFAYYIGFDSAILLGVYLAAKKIWEIVNEYDNNIIKEKNNNNYENIDDLYNEDGYRFITVNKEDNTDY